MVIVLVRTGIVHRQHVNARMKRIVFVTALFLIAVLVWWWAGGRSVSRTDPGVGDDVALKTIYSNTQELDAIRGNYFTFISDPYTVGVWTQMVFGGEQKPTSLNAFLAAAAVSIDANLLARIEQKNWYLYRCSLIESSGTGGGNIVLAVRFAEDQDSLDIQRNLLAWEPTFISSVSALVFPYDLYKSNPVPVGDFVSASEYSYATLRAAPVRIDGHGQGQVGYLYFGQYLLIGGDRSCLREAEERLFEIQSG